MKTLVSYLAFIFAFAIIIDRAEAQTSYNIKSEKITVAGSSSLHDWVSEVTKVEWSGVMKVENRKLVEVSKAHIKIPVIAIKSDKGRIMDNKTYEAFNDKKYPTISYQMSGATLSGDVIKATGILSMAGASRSIEMNVKYKMMTNEDIQLIGSYTLNMKDYKMEPPTAVMGTIKVGEEVTVSFDLMLSPGQDISQIKK
ncbi:MAG: YceI family protein [Cyclobacteriaceae bacterium]|nr:YceI family protein [Cyclobacteriaceae bacterium]